MLWFIIAFLTGAAILSVLWPLSRHPRVNDPATLDVAFYEAQTAEIEREASRGLIPREEAESARTEAARRLVLASRGRRTSAASSSPWPVRTVAIGVLVFVPAVALGLYRQVGAPDLPDRPLQARLEAPPAQLDMAAAIAKIEQHVAQHPDDGRGWAVLAPVYLRLQRFDDAKRALANVIRLLGPSADRYAALGEAQVFESGGTVNEEAKRSFQSAIGLDPKTPRAAFYLGLAAEQEGDKAKAVSIWRRLVADSPADALWLPVVRNHIAEASGEPLPATQEDARPQGKLADAVAAMPADQQQTMIRRMVDGLAGRLQSNGNDIDGWLRLVRAYRVLNEQEKARLALTNAKRNFAADPAATRRLDDLAHELGLEG